MKKWLILFLSLPAIMISSCSKSNEDKCSFTDSNTAAPAAEITYLQNYITTNSIPALQHPSGVFYTIGNTGSGGTAGVCSRITVNYTGSLIPGGTVFDNNAAINPTSFVLGQLILGWQRVLPLIKSGGNMVMYIPPSLGYGPYDRTDNLGNVVIPANSYLKFEVSLLEVQ